MLSVIMLIVIMLSVAMLSVIMPSVVMLYLKAKPLSTNMSLVHLNIPTN